MVPLSLFRSRELSATTAIGCLLALLPQAGVIAFGFWLGGRIASRSGPRIPVIVGMAVGAAGFFALTMISKSVSYWVIVLPMAATGFGISFTMPAATAAVVEGAPAERPA